MHSFSTSNHSLIAVSLRDCSEPARCRQPNESGVGVWQLSLLDDAILYGEPHAKAAWSTSGVAAAIVQRAAELHLRRWKYLLH